MNKCLNISLTSINISDLAGGGNIGNKEKAEIKFILANSDHCGKPLVVKDIIDNKTKASFKKDGSSYQ